MGVLAVLCLSVVLVGLGSAKTIPIIPLNASHAVTVPILPLSLARPRMNDSFRGAGDVRVDIGDRNITGICIAPAITKLL